MLDGDTATSNEVPFGASNRRDPAMLWSHVQSMLGGMDLSGVQALAVAGTSGTLLPVALDGTALGPLQLYNDPVPADLRAARLLGTPGLHRVLHEADWVAGQFSGRFDTSDENNALKTGYDPGTRAWARPSEKLPRVLPPGSAVAPVLYAMRMRYGLAERAVVVAGTTDGCASFLSTGADRPGDGVTALGSTLTLKLLSDVPVASREHGVYSHRLLGHWLPGGASNTGGAVLASLFTPGEMVALSKRIDPARDSGLDYYPLLQPGERFPQLDPALPPRMTPRPDDDALFLHGLLEGIARLEAEGYRLLRQLGAPPLRRVLSVGGGSANPVWTAIRARILGVAVTSVPSSAAHGAALLARHGL